MDQNSFCQAEPKAGLSGLRLAIFPWSSYPLRGGEIFKIMNSISFQVKFHVFIYRYYGTMVKNNIFRCLGLRKHLGRSCKSLYNSKIIFFFLWRSWYSKRPARAHGLNAKIGFKNKAPSPKILAKTSENMQVWFGDLNFGSFWLISKDSVLCF